MGAFLYLEACMKEFTFDHVWTVQELFYQDRDLMYKSNQDVRTLLKRLEEECVECGEEIQKCMVLAGVGGVVNLCAQEVRQEISDLFLFVIAIARCCGLTAQDILVDAVDKVARNTGRYQAKDYQDTTADFKDQQNKSRSEDKSRGFTTSFYQIAA